MGCETTGSLAPSGLGQRSEASDDRSVLKRRLVRLPSYHSAGLERLRPAATLGAGLLYVAIPLFVLGCGYIFPGQGYFGISMTSSGFGIVFLNTFAALCGGAIAGLPLAYRTRNSFWALVGPIAGYISCAALLDFSKPWTALLVGMAGPFVAFAVDRILVRIHIDEHKIVPLGLGCGSFGAIVAGFVGWGVKTGGYPGLTGKYAFQHAHITPGWQLVGLGVTLAVAGGSALIVAFGLEKTIGLRVSEADERRGLDDVYWPDITAPARDPEPTNGAVPVQPHTARVD